MEDKVSKYRTHFLFIQEGKNGEDSLDNINRRANGQALGIFGFLEFLYSQKYFIKNTVYEERNILIQGNVSEIVAIQKEHVSNGEKLKVSLSFLYSNTDSLITVSDVILFCITSNDDKDENRNKR